MKKAVPDYTKFMKKPSKLPEQGDVIHESARTDHASTPDEKGSRIDASGVSGRGFAEELRASAAKEETSLKASASVKSVSPGSGAGIPATDDAVGKEAGAEPSPKVTLPGNLEAEKIPYAEIIPFLDSVTAPAPGVADAGPISNKVQGDLFRKELHTAEIPFAEIVDWKTDIESAPPAPILNRSFFDFGRHAGPPLIPILITSLALLALMRMQ